MFSCETLTEKQLTEEDREGWTMCFARIPKSSRKVDEHAIPGGDTWSWISGHWTTSGSSWKERPWTGMTGIPMSVAYATGGI